MRQLSMSQKLDILRFYTEAGVDCALDEKTQNQLKNQAPNVSTPAPSAAPVGQQAIGLAQALAQQANSLDALKQVMENFEGCDLKKRAKNLVFGDGNPEASIMFVGEAPGRDEDEMGKPFVGRSGQLLNKILAHAGFDRSNIYIANTVPWRPPGNRAPSPMEVQIVRPFIERQIELVAPKILVGLGAVAARQILDTTKGIMSLRGSWHELTIGTHALWVSATLHPAYLLRQPTHKALIWRDILSIKHKIASL